MKQLFRSLFFIALLYLIPGCRTLNPSQMFKQNDYQYFQLAQKKMEQYTIVPGDEISIQVYSRDGFKMVDVMGNLLNTSANLGNNGSDLFIVDNEGFAKIPILGQFYVKGYSEAELEKVLAERYAGLFVDPYVIIRVSNRHAIVFEGEKAEIIKLNNSPTNLIEVLAKAGGLDVYGKAFRIKIIRGDLKNPVVYMVDLSTIEGMRKANLIVENNDIIYVERKANYPRELLKDITPAIALVTSLSTLIFLVLRLGK